MQVRRAFSRVSPFLLFAKRLRARLTITSPLTNCGMPTTGVDDVEDLLEELAAHLLGVAAGQRRLRQPQVLRGVEDQVVHLRGGVLPVFGEASEGDALAQVGRVLQSHLLSVVVADLVQLDEEVLEHEGRLLGIDQARRLVTLIERLQVLAEVGLGVAATDLLDLRADVAEEVALDGFPQVPGRMLGHPLAGLGDGDQLRLAGCVLLLRRHLPGQLGIAVRQPDDGLHRDQAGLVEVELRCVRQPHVEGLLPLLDLLDHAGQALVVDPGVVQVAAATRPGHELRDEAGLVDRVRIKAVLLDEDLVGPRPQRPLVPVLERPLVRLAVFRGLRLLDGLLFLHPLDVPFRIRVDAR